MDPNTEEPTVTPVVEEPTIAPVVEEPTITPVVEEPTIAPVVEEPTITPVVEEPTIAPVVEEPTIAPVVQNILANTRVLETPIDKTFKLLGFSVTVIYLQLGQYARLAVHLNCARGEQQYMEYKELLLEGEDYLAWGSDDKYIIDFVQSKLSNLF